ncbi:MAG: hypothetical protein WCJ97_02390 [Phycisphaerae bacterium]
MKTRMQFWTTLSMFLLLMGSMLVSDQTRAADGEKPVVAATQKSTKLPQVRGFSMQLNNPNGAEEYRAALDDLSALGCNWINFAVAARMKDVKSNDVYINWQNLPTLKTMESIIKHAKKKGMRVMIMPMVLLDKAGTKEWRGVIQPTDWEQWFFSYRQYMSVVANLAAKSEADILCVGSELLSTEADEQRWTQTIREIKSVYSGKLTYSANWDHYKVPTFWGQLDYIGMNNYNELASGRGATVAQLVKTWQPIKRDILRFAEEQKKPFMFTEVGWHNLDNTVKEPWNYVALTKIDPREQANAFQSFVEVWGEEKAEKFMGAFIWEWVSNAKPTDPGSYCPKGQPAMEIISKWLKLMPAAGQ